MAQLKHTMAQGEGRIPIFNAENCTGHDEVAKK